MTLRSRMGLPTVEPQPAPQPQPRTPEWVRRSQERKLPAKENLR